MTKLLVLVSGVTRQQVRTAWRRTQGPAGPSCQRPVGPSAGRQDRCLHQTAGLARNQPFGKWVKLFPKLRIRQVPFFRLGF